MKKLLYLASPFWHNREDVRQWRIEQARKAAARLIEKHEYDVYSPVVHGHAICETSQHLIDRHDIWIAHGINVLRRCDLMGVLMLPGWKESKGVQLELEVAKAINLRVLLFEWRGLTGS